MSDESALIPLLFSARNTIRLPHAIITAFVVRSVTRGDVWRGHQASKRRFFLGSEDPKDDRRHKL